MTAPSVSVALVGCGQIADAHLQEINKIDRARVVAVCDQHEDLAYQARMRFGVASQYADVEKMLASAKPDVVHITTPPHTHLAIALRCLEAGAHVYVEKPFTLDVHEADRLFEAADARGRLVCAGHDHLFLPAWQECLSMIGAGTLGDVVHLDCIRGYDLNGPYGALIVADQNHWIHRMPGGIFQNVISHAVCLITPFIGGDAPSVVARSFAGAHGTTLPTELRSMIIGARTTAAVSVSSLARPVQRLARVCGTRGTIEVDFDSGLIRVAPVSRLPGALGRVETPLRHVLEATKNLGTNVGRFMRSELQYFAGMNQLFRLFYDAVADGTPTPVPYADVRQVTTIMDEIFRQSGARSSPDAYLAKGAA